MPIIKRIASGLLAIVVALAGTPLVSAQSGEFNLRYNVNNGVVFYDGQNPGEPCSDGISAGSSVTTTTKLDQNTMDRILRLKTVYKQASQKTGTPWEIYAAIDYRENNNASNKSMLGGEPLGQKAVDSGNTPNTKLESILMGDKILRGLAKGVYGVSIGGNMSFDDLQKAFIVYNRGYSYKRANTSPDKSPYVMNNFDAKHKNMTFPSIPGETLAGKRETRFGAMTIYANVIGDSLSAACPGATGTASECPARPEMAKFILGSNKFRVVYGPVEGVKNDIRTPFKGQGEGAHDSIVCVIYRLIKDVDVPYLSSVLNAGHSPGGDHPRGLAADHDFDSDDPRAKKVIDYLLENHKELKLSQVIWDGGKCINGGKIVSCSTYSSGLRAQHNNHIHIATRQ